MSSKSFTLDDIREAAEKKYGATTFPDVPGGEVRLVNVLRLSKDKRDALKAVQKRAKEHGDDEDFDVAATYRESIEIVAETAEQASRLIEEFGEDLGALATIFNLYTSETEMGEASASQN